MGSQTLYFVNFAYKHLSGDLFGPDLSSFHSEMHAPLKLKVFLWQIFLNSILTKDNMVKRCWPGDPKCFFCHKDESLKQPFFECTVAKFVWGCTAATSWALPWSRKYLAVFHLVGKTAQDLFVSVLLKGWVICVGLYGKPRMGVCFEKKILHHPESVVYTLCSFLQFWAPSEGATTTTDEGWGPWPISGGGGTADKNTRKIMGWGA